MNSIDINNITKDYGDHKGVFDVSFSLRKGEVLGFLGPNGAGKTTTIRQLMGFIKPDIGTVTINGMDCFKKADKIQKDVGYLPGEIAFMEDMKGIDFIHFIAKMKGLTNLDRANELITYFEINPDHHLKKMSKGMKQKIGIICAFMHDPDILLLDEPTSGLDPLMQNKFVDLILEEKKKGKTILMSSHMFEEIEKTCDRVAIIKEGKIVALQSIDELQKNKVKHFVITFKNNNDVFEFIKEYPIAKTKNNQVDVMVKDISAFIRTLAKFEILDIHIEKQTIEDIFLHFYGGNTHD